MIHRHAFEALERTVKDLMNERKDKTKEKVFGGKTLLFGGDFRHILPVIRGGSRENIVDASISRSRLWKHFHVFELSENMRLLNGNCNSAEKQSISEFNKWILDLGDEKLPAKAIEGEDDEPTWIKIPDDLLIESGKEHVFLSFDSISPQSYDFENAELLYNQEYLNSQKLSGVPNHVLRLKLNVPVMLTRNINPSAGLCNGTRLIVTRIMARTIQVKIITGSAAGQSAVISRIVIQPTETHLPFILRRVQFPIKVCFSTTINKSQVQSIDNVGIYLPNPIFCDGQLYVAVSRTTSRSGLKIQIDKTKDIVPKGYTQNVVYREIFTNSHQKHKTHQIQEISSDRSHLEGDQETDEEMTPSIEDSGEEFSAFNNTMIEDSGDEFSTFNNIVIEDSGSEKGDQESDEEMALFVEDSDDEY
ncbi:ATP-dependent DNA helicase PIF1-like [Papaver somniferum]|uniref:ATP-dependent DNA helicase PIF1-like n=1 Tax=Papaver somniferum TaxID=3469 RepID=UPI000E6FF892|nr:ATP-dependent DNA helicase PIF1-like [Papaver somniferum]